MKRLIIITGISGCGKTTIAKKLYMHFEKSTVLSMDTLRENIYDLVGFYSKAQKEALKEPTYEIFQTLLQICMKRQDETIIIEFPFHPRWQQVFENYLNVYQYTAITVHVYGIDYDDIYEKLQKRNNSATRHPAHSLAVYNPKYRKQYISKNELSYQSQKKDYENKKYTTICLGKVVNYINDEKHNIDMLIRQIESMK